jgi:hypothetical protein
MKHGKTLEDFTSNNIESLYEKKDTPSFLNYNGSTTKSALILAFTHC